MYYSYGIVVYLRRLRDKAKNYIKVSGLYAAGQTRWIKHRARFQLKGGQKVSQIWGPLYFYI